MNFSESPEFQKDVKALGKKVRTLRSDIERVYARIEPLYVAVKDVDLQTYRTLFFDGKRATILHKTETHEVIKMRLDTDTRTAQGKLRLVFIAMVKSGTVTFIEVYAKNNKAREDHRRIKKYLG
jgi:hypothetical protein